MITRFKYVLFILFQIFCLQSIGQNTVSKIGQKIYYNLTFEKYNWSPKKIRFPKEKMTVLDRRLINGYTILFIKNHPIRYMDAETLESAQNAISIVFISPKKIFYYISPFVCKKYAITLGGKITIPILQELGTPYFKENIRQNELLCPHNESNCKSYGNFKCHQANGKIFKMLSITSPDEMEFDITNHNFIRLFRYEHHGTPNTIVADFF